MALTVAMRAPARAGPLRPRRRAASGAGAAARRRRPAGRRAPVRMATASVTVTSAPQARQRRRSSSSPPQPRCWRIIGRSPSRAWRSPHWSRATSTGHRSAPFSVRRYSRAQRALLVRALDQDPLLDQALQADLQDVARHAQVALEVVEAPDAQEDVPDDQQRPALADHLEGRGHRAVLGRVVPLQHPPSIPHNFPQWVVLCNFLSYSAFHDRTDREPTPPAADARPGRSLTALIVLTGVFLSSLDLFIVNIAFPSISATFHGESLSSLSWVLSAYTIVFAAALVPAGRWADRAGRKRAFLIGLAIFTASSALCAVAPSLEFLVGARVLQASRRRPHAAHLARPPAARLRSRPARARPSACGRPSAARPPPSARRSAGCWSRPAGAGSSWSTCPSAVVALVFGVRLLDEVRDPDAHKSDLLGAGLLTVAVASLVAAIVEGSDWGWTSGADHRRLRAGRRRRAPGWSCAPSATPTPSSSRPSSATAPWRWPTSARWPSSAASVRSCSAASSS